MKELISSYSDQQHVQASAEMAALCEITELLTMTGRTHSPRMNGA